MGTGEAIGKAHDAASAVMILTSNMSRSPLLHHPLGSSEGSIMATSRSYTVYGIELAESLYLENEPETPLEVTLLLTTGNTLDADNLGLLTYSELHLNVRR